MTEQKPVEAGNVGDKDWLTTLLLAILYSPVLCRQLKKGRVYDSCYYFYMRNRRNDLGDYRHHLYCAGHFR